MIEVQGTLKSLQQLRLEAYEKIVDDTVFIARASEGAISVEWVMSQPIAIRKKYVEDFNDELNKRKQRMEQMNRGKHRK